MSSSQNPYSPPIQALPHGVEPPIVAELAGDDDGLRVDFELFPEDILAFNEYHHRNSPELRRQLLRVRLTVAAIFVGVIGVLIWQAFRLPELWFVVLCLSVALTIFFFLHPYLHRLQLRRIVGRMYAEGRNLALYGPRRVSLTPEFLNMSSPYSQSLTRWLAIERVAVAHEAIYIYQFSVSAFIIPRRVFSSDDAFQSFAREVVAHHARAMAVWQPAADTGGRG